MQQPAALQIAHPVLDRRRRGSGGGLHGAGQITSPRSSGVREGRDVDRDGRRRGQRPQRRVEWRRIWSGVRDVISRITLRRNGFCGGGRGVAGRLLADAATIGDSVGGAIR